MRLKRGKIQDRQYEAEKGENTRQAI